MWAIEYASRSVERELDGLPRDLRADIVRIADMLRAKGPQQVAMPHVKRLENQLWEIRARGASGIGRVLYSELPGQRLVFLHAFMKKTEKTPRRSIQLALRRLRERV